jgi:hypothetical protein
MPDDGAGPGAGGADDADGGPGGPQNGDVEGTTGSRSAGVVGRAVGSPGAPQSVPEELGGSCWGGGQGAADDVAGSQSPGSGAAGESCSDGATDGPVWCTAQGDSVRRGRAAAGGTCAQGDSIGGVSSALFATWRRADSCG